MPLKESDLADAESYKKATRQDLAKVVTGNSKFWVYKDVELGGASGKKQKYPAFLALVDDNGIRKAMAGKKLICKGTCGLQDNRIAFEPSTGTVPYHLLKTSVPLLLGKPVLIPNGQDKAEDEPGANAAPKEVANGAEPPKGAGPPAPPAKQPSPAAPVVTNGAGAGAWTKLTNDVRAYAAAHPERKAALFREMTAIAALLKANKAAEAKPKMERIQVVLAAPAPAARGPQKTASRWSAMVKQLQSAVAASPDRKAELVRLTAGLPNFIRAGKLDAAEKQMDAVERALKVTQALKVTPRAKEYRARRQAIEGRLAAAVKEGGRNASQLRALDVFISAKAQSGDFETALKALVRLEGALAAKPAATGGRPPAQKADEAKRETDEDDDEEAKAEAAQFQKDLRGRMIAAMGQVTMRMPRAGQEPKPQMQFMAYLAGNRTAVIVAKKTGGSMKKVLLQIAGVPGGKIAHGECIFERNAHTFVLAKPPGGMAKLLAGALLSETGTKYKVRVRAIDNSVVLDDETDVEPAAAGAARQAEWEKRFGEIEPRYLATLKEQPSNAGEMRAVLSAAQGSAGKGDFAGALAALKRLETLLEAAKTLGRETDVIPEGIVKQTVEKLQMASTRWREVHFQSVEGLESLMRTLRAEEDPELHEIADRVDRLTKGIPSEIEADLAQLSLAVQGRNAADVAKWAKQVEAGVETCTSYLEQSLPAIERCEENPFDLPVTIQAPMRTMLADIRAALADLQPSAA